jgi:hypothetical protein
MASNPPKDNKNIIILRPKNGDQRSKQTLNEVKNVVKKHYKTIGVKEVDNKPRRSTDEMSVGTRR